jgi:uncharacterized membrane protein YkvA (DUF1232 family)
VAGVGVSVEREDNFWEIIMQTTVIRQQIANAVSHEQQTGSLAALLRQFAQMHGLRPTAEEVGGTVSFIREYIEHAPAFLEAVAAAAVKAGASRDVSPILEAAEQYFLAPLDLIPDHLGLVGLMDDAYLAHKLIQGVADNYRNQTGNVLLPLPLDLTKTNQAMRNLIGEPLASQLDAAVAATFGSPQIQQVLNQFSMLSDSFSMSRDPVWGNASIDEIVDVRLGAMGVV